MQTYIWIILGVLLVFGLVKKIWGLVKFLAIAAAVVAVLYYFNLI